MLRWPIIFTSSIVDVVEQAGAYIDEGTTKCDVRQRKKTGSYTRIEGHRTPKLTNAK